MAFNLRNRNWLKELDFTKEEINFLLDLSRDLKRGQVLRVRAEAPGGEEHRADL